MSEPKPQSMQQQCPCCQRQESEVKWLALLLRQGLKVIVAGIDARYGESRSSKERREQAA